MGGSILPVIMDFIFKLLDDCEESEAGSLPRPMRDARRERRLNNPTPRDVRRLGRAYRREVGMSRAEYRRDREDIELQLEDELAEVSKTQVSKAVRTWRKDRGDE